MSSYTKQNIHKNVQLNSRDDSLLDTPPRQSFLFHSKYSESMPPSYQSSPTSGYVESTSSQMHILSDRDCGDRVFNPLFTSSTLHHTLHNRMSRDRGDTYPSEVPSLKPNPSLFLVDFQYPLLPLSESMYNIQIVETIDQEALRAREAWINAQPTLRKRVSETHSMTYFERFDEKIYWQLYDASSIAFTESWHDPYNKKTLLKKALKYIDASITLEPKLWFSYHLKYKIYCASGDATKATDTMTKLEAMLEKQGLVYELLNICYATKIYADLEKGDLESATKHISEAKAKEKELHTMLYELSENPLKIVEKQYETIKYEMQRTSSDESEPRSPKKEIDSSQQSSFSGTFIRACDIFSDTLAKARIKNSIEALRKDISETREQVDGLELKLSKLQASINKAFIKSDSKTLDLENYLRSIDSEIHDSVVQYSKAYVLTMMRSLAISTALIGNEVKIDTDSILKSATIALFGAIPLCGSTVARIVDYSIDSLQTHNIRENSAKMVRMVSNDNDMYLICQEVLKKVLTNEAKISEIINERSHQKAGFFQKIYEKIHDISGAIQGGEIYTTYATKLAYHDAIHSIKDGLKLYGTQTETIVFASTGNVIKAFTHSILPHEELEQDALESFLDDDDTNTYTSNTTTYLLSEQNSPKCEILGAVNEQKPYTITDFYNIHSSYV